MMTDFSAWDLHDRLTIHEAAMLWLDQDPHSVGPDNPDPNYKTIKTALIRAVSRGEIECFRNYATVEEILNPDAPVNWDESKLQRGSLAHWAAGRDQAPAFLKGDLARRGYESSAPVMVLADPPSAVEAYRTPLLDILRLAIAEHWINFDPNNPPKGSKIIDWLKSEHGVSQRAAEAIDLIIRHESRQRGGQTKSSDEY